MRIADYIRNKKESFKDSMANRKLNKLEIERASLEREKAREEKLQVARAERDRVSSQIQQIQPNKEESKLMRFGKGLAEVINKQRENPNLRKPKDLKPKLNIKAFGVAVKSSPIFQGSSGLNMGMGETREQYKPKNKSPFA